MNTVSAYRDTAIGTIEAADILKRFSQGALTALLIFSAGGSALADNDHERALDLMKRGEILPLTTILDRVTAQYPGKFLKVELEEEDADIIYEIELLGKDGTVREIMIDAKSGKLLSVEGE